MKTVLIFFLTLTLLALKVQGWAQNTRFRTGTWNTVNVKYEIAPKWNSKLKAVTQDLYTNYDGTNTDDRFRFRYRLQAIVPISRNECWRTRFISTFPMRCISPKSFLISIRTDCLQDSVINLSTQASRQESCISSEYAHGAAEKRLPAADVFSDVQTKNETDNP